MHAVRLRNLCGKAVLLQAVGTTSSLNPTAMSITDADEHLFNWLFSELFFHPSTGSFQDKDLLQD